MKHSNSDTKTSSFRSSKQTNGNASSDQGTATPLQKLGDIKNIELMFVEELNKLVTRGQERGVMKGHLLVEQATDRAITGDFRAMKMLMELSQRINQAIVDYTRSRNPKLSQEALAKLSAQELVDLYMKEIKRTAPLQ